MYYLENRAQVLSDVISACESGWDFSTRWFRSKCLATVTTSDIIPVDLNSFLYWNEIILAKFHGLLGRNRMYNKCFQWASV